MSRWTTVKDIRKKLEREWDKGVLLVARLCSEEKVPKRIVLKKPTRNEWVDEWGDAKAWVDELVDAEKMYPFRLEVEEVNHRQLGRNKFPQAVIFETDDSILQFLGKLSSAKQFDEICQRILADFPELRPWLAKRPLVALDHHINWPRFLSVLNFLKNNPRPGIYVRQLKIPEIDTKFIENNKKVISELLDLVLPDDVIDSNATGVKKFEPRYGFLSKPIQVRFRFLDPDFYIAGLSDLQIPVEEFCKLCLDVDQIFMTENEVNGLAFPDVKKAIVIFGLGFGLDRLAGIEWLKAKKIYYWGDIDTHGYVILDQLRSYFSDADSFLMDKDTLMKHRAQWGTEDQPAKRALYRLREEEQEVYSLLVNNTLYEGLRLEQEKVSFDIVQTKLKQMTELN